MIKDSANVFARFIIIIRIAHSFAMFKTILIAANDPNIIYLLKRYAEASGFQVVSSEQGKQLLELAQQTQPALILLEVEALEGPWQQSLNALKNDQNTQHIPVVAHSCYEHIDCSQANEIAGTLQKSVMYSDFVTMLEKIGIQSADPAM
jgi:CheY-like chemotaxis protein